MRWAVWLIVIAGTLVFLRFGFGEPDPRSGYASVQRIILAQIIGSERDFITGWDRSAESVRVSGNIGYVEGWYTTRISTTRLPYQMTVRHDASSNVYTSQCFVLIEEIENGAAPCF